MRILLIHGPNLNLLGKREPKKYGNTNSDEITQNLKAGFPEIQLDYYQSNQEGELIDALQKSDREYKGVIINAGGFSHTSVSIADTIRSISVPVIAVHITNIYQRENYRHKDIVGEACIGSIAGLGTEGYQLAMECLLDEIKIRSI